MIQQNSESAYSLHSPRTCTQLWVSLWHTGSLCVLRRQEEWRATSSTLKSSAAPPTVFHGLVHCEAVLEHENFVWDQMCLHEMRPRGRIFTDQHCYLGLTPLVWLWYLQHCTKFETQCMFLPRTFQQVFRTDQLTRSSVSVSQSPFTHQDQDGLHGAGTVKDERTFSSISAKNKSSEHILFIYCHLKTVFSGRMSQLPPLLALWALCTEIPCKYNLILIWVTT